MPWKANMAYERTTLQISRLNKTNKNAEEKVVVHRGRCTIKFVIVCLTMY